MYKQLVNANTKVIGKPEMCLSYVEDVFAAPHLYPTAWAAWGATKHKHIGLPPVTVSVPIWFSWTGTLDGVRQNYGHVAAWVHGKIYSTSAQGDKVFNTVQELVNYMGEGIEYVGWSEDLAGKRIVQPAPPPAQANNSVVGKTLFLPKDNPTWRVYPLNKRPVIGNEVAKILPAKFGGLSYKILGNPFPSTYTIQTQDFGKVNIWCGPGTDAQIK
jgi:hypothetical protein